MMRCAILCAIATMATTSCAAPVSLAASQPVVLASDDEWFLAAKKLLIDNVQAESAYKLKLVDCAEQRDVALIQKREAQKIADDATNGSRGFLQNWGLPIGIVLGLVGGSVVALASRGSK